MWKKKNRRVKKKENQSGLKTIHQKWVSLITKLNKFKNKKPMIFKMHYKLENSIKTVKQKSWVRWRARRKRMQKTCTQREREKIREAERKED